MTNGVFVPQYNRPLRVFGFGTIAQRCFDVGPIRTRGVRKGRVGIIQIEVDLTEQRMEPIIHMTYLLFLAEVLSITLGHLRSHEQVSGGWIPLGVSR